MRDDDLRLAETNGIGNISKKSRLRSSETTNLPLFLINDSTNRTGDCSPIAERGGSILDENTPQGIVGDGRGASNDMEAVHDNQTTDLELALKNSDLIQAKGILSRAVSSEGGEKDKILKLSPAKLFELISAPDSLPIQASEVIPETPGLSVRSENRRPNGEQADEFTMPLSRVRSGSTTASPIDDDFTLRSPIAMTNGVSSSMNRPSMSSRAVSTPAMKRKPSGKPPSIATISNSQTKPARSALGPIDTKEVKPDAKTTRRDELLASPIPPSIPLPPMSIPAYLQLELSSNKPSPLYLYRPSTSNVAYESSQVKIERLISFFLLPFHLEQVLWFGAIACFDAWLYTFTILPLRFIKALFMLGHSWSVNLLSEIRFLATFIYIGLGRMWKRRRIVGQDDSAPGSSATTGVTLERSHLSVSGAESEADRYPSLYSEPKSSTKNGASQPELSQRRNIPRHCRTKSVPSSLQPTDKADILKGFLILFSCFILMRFDASMMYHSIRGQAAIKLYVIYNVLEVRVSS